MREPPNEEHYHRLPRSGLLLCEGGSPWALPVTRDFRAANGLPRATSDCCAAGSRDQGDTQTKRPAVAITFDDGYRNVLTVAAPILSSYGFEATVFVPTMWIAGRNGWMEQSSCDFHIMSEKELRDATENGIRIESHGHAHIDMSNSSYTEIHKDVQTSVERLAGIMGRRPRYLAYPWGRHSEAARRAVAEAGLEAAFSIDQPHQGVYAWDRVYIAPHDGPKTFTLKTSGHFLSWRRSRLGSSIAAATRSLRRQ